MDSSFVFAMRTYASLAEREDCAEIIEIISELSYMDSVRQSRKNEQPKKIAQKSESKKEANETDQSVEYQKLSADENGKILASPIVIPISVPAPESQKLFDSNNKEHRELLRPLFRNRGMDLRRAADLAIAETIKIRLDSTPLEGLINRFNSIMDEINPKQDDTDPGF